MDFFVDLRSHDRTPLRSRLEREIREAVRSGRLLAGAPMPSSRALCAQLGVSRGVVVEAYSQLVAEGYLSARQGARTVVAERARAGTSRRAEADAAAPRSGGGSAYERLGVTERHTAHRMPVPAHVPRYDLRYGTPDLSAFPRAAWIAAGARGMRRVPDSRLDYGSAGGAIELREALAGYLGRTRGVIAEADRILVTGGTRHGLGVIWNVLRDRGARGIAIEDPGWGAQRQTVLDAGLEPIPVAVDELGLRAQDLERSSADAVAVTAAHQCPTGVVLAPERRTRLLEWARGRDSIVVEDDYDAEYRYDRDPVGALQGMDPERVAYAGTASKSLAPALRLGWLVLPARLAEAAVRCQFRADRGEPLHGQLALAELIERGELDRHLRRTRRRYRARRAALVAAVTEQLPGARVEGIAAGLHAVVRLPAGADEDATVLAAAQRGIALDGLASFARTTSTQPALVVGYANLTEPAIQRAITALAGALR